ncbi:hypothetical protein Tco_0226409 [Tanacetum coccineum]
MLAPGNYAQWSSWFMRYIDTKPNKDQLRQCIKKSPYILTQLVTLEVPVEGDELGQPRVVREETYVNTTPENKKLIDAEAESIHMILSRIGNDIYSTMDACPTAREMWLAIERLHQGESINIQDVKTKLFWEFGKFTSRVGESIKSYYTRVYRMMNEMARNKLKANTVNVQFLQQLQPVWSRFMTIVKKQQDLDTFSFHKLFDILKQHQNEVNEICAERIAKNANSLVLVAAAQHYQDDYTQAPKPYKTHAHSSSTRTHATTRNKGKEIVKPPSPPSESAYEEDTDEERAQRDKQMLEKFGPHCKTLQEHLQTR